MILTDREIKIAIGERLIEINPPPDETVAFSATAVDLTLDSNIATFDAPATDLDIEIDPNQADFNIEQAAVTLTTRQKIAAQGFLLQPRIFVLAWTRERVRLPAPARVAARVEGKSSLARCGLAVHMTAPTIHSGFDGQIWLEMMNHGPVPVRLKSGMRICQLILETTLGTPEKGYQGQFSGQTVKGRRTGTA